MHITLAEASSIVDAALARAREGAFNPMAAAVIDAGGHLVAFKREDRSGILRFEIAFAKAYGALGMSFGSRENRRPRGGQPGLHQRPDRRVVNSLWQKGEMLWL